MSESEIRKDYFRDKYVIIAPKRNLRPKAIVEKIVKTDLAKECFFCPENLKNKNVTYQDNNIDGNWEIISIINDFPAVSLDNPKAYGQAEVLIETRKHGLDINDFSVDHIVRIFNAYINRYETLKNIDGIKYVIIFKNEGGKAGASIAHTHSQIIALPLLPPAVKDETRDYGEYRLTHRSCPYCDILSKEANSERLIWEDENIFALSPYASDSPYGAWLIPKRHICSISDLTHLEKESIAIALKIILQKLDDLGIAYNYFIENSVNGEDYHMHIKIAPRPNVWAGLELGTGVIVNPISPEDAAKIYREQIKD